ncbi:MAG TPA: hypothetical protein VHX11_06685 [Acidobacteriaceae bacterium]|jgi:hypothetical protein|nr:hypothetical protein [Acidobacteriaceae bacterium]
MAPQLLDGHAYQLGDGCSMWSMTRIWMLACVDLELEAELVSEGLVKGRVPRRAGFRQRLLVQRPPVLKGNNRAGRPIQSSLS